MVNTLSDLLKEETVAGHPCDILEPAARGAADIVAIYLHDSVESRLCDQPELLSACRRQTLAIVAPHTGRSWWTDRVCPAFDDVLTTEQLLLDHVLPLIRERWGVEPPRIGLFGSEMGGQGALRFAYKHPRQFQAVAAVSPLIDYQIVFDQDEHLQAMYRDREAVRQDTALLHVHPLNWPLHQFFCCDPSDYASWDGADRLHMKLASSGIPHEHDLETTIADRQEYENRMMQRAVAFLTARLRRESRT
jgi:S-formylglutathione hydrolase